MDLAQQFDAASVGTDAHGDLLLQNGDLALIDNVGAITQAAVQNMRTLQGEVFLNVELGVPYYQSLFGQRGSLSPFEQALQGAILATPGVLALSYWNITTVPAQRRLDIVFRATTALGPISWSGSVTG